MSYRDQLKAEARTFAERVKSMGFRAFLAEQGDYGFITDDAGTRVLSFGFSMGANLSGNYGPPSRESGTGWKMDETPAQLDTAEQVRKALYASAPNYCGTGWKHYTTVAQHLAHYGSSSRYSEV